MTVRFKTLPDPKNPQGLLLTFEIVDSLAHDENPLTVAFNNKFELDSAFMAAGIFLRDTTQPDPERTAIPDPDQHFEVDINALRKIGFDIPK
jgi:hypothetical protein